MSSEVQDSCSPHQFPKDNLDDFPTRMSPLVNNSGIFFKAEYYFIYHLFLFFIFWQNSWKYNSIPEFWTDHRNLHCFKEVRDRNWRIISVITVRKWVILLFLCQEVCLSVISKFLFRDFWNISHYLHSYRYWPKYHQFCISFPASKFRFSPTFCSDINLSSFFSISCWTIKLCSSRAMWFQTCSA